MGVMDFIKGQFIDVIEYVDKSNKMIVHKYNRYNDEIKQGANLIVRNGQSAIFVCKGQIADLFESGSYTLNTGNLPILSSLAAVPSLFNSPIKSDLYFINTTQFVGNNWKTKNPILLRDEDFNMVRITGFGTYSFVIENSRKFMEEVFGARKLDMTYDILQYLNSFMSESIALAIGEAKTPVLEIAQKYRSLGTQMIEYVNIKAYDLGIKITDITIENISLPESVEKIIDEQSGIGITSKNMDNFMKYQTARAMRDAAKQDGGLAGLGAGFAFGNQIASNISETTSNSSESTIDKLREYKGLLDEGIITDEEFKELKKKILGI